jgi:hypothetical protein
LIINRDFHNGNRDFYVVNRDFYNDKGDFHIADRVFDDGNRDFHLSKVVVILASAIFTIVISIFRNNSKPPANMTINNPGKTILFLVFLSALSFLPVSAQPEKNFNKKALFLTVLETRLAQSGLTLEKFCPQNNIFTRRILVEYGAVFVGRGKLARSCYLKDENTVRETQNQFNYSSQTVGGVKIELQSAAMEALLKAVAEAKKQGLSVTPRGGASAARRNFETTVSFWESRVEPGLKHWVEAKKLTPKQANQIRGMSIFEQIIAILELEEKKLFFSTNLDKSILQSVAAPGASQHNLMLALDVAQFDKPRVRRILAKYGWFQTVASDKPHFTYMGVAESELPSLGLHSVQIDGQTFWIPRLTAGR